MTRITNWSTKKVKTFYRVHSAIVRIAETIRKGFWDKNWRKIYSADAKIFFKDDNDTLDMTNEAFIVGSSLYRMSIQMLVAKAVLY